jgi:hypothetical protein
VRDLLCPVRSWPLERLLDLAPIHWKQTVEPPEAQARLRGNVLRRVALRGWLELGIAPHLDGADTGA